MTATPTSPRPSPRALVLDLGEVLVRSQPAALVERMARIAGVPLADFKAAYWAHRHEYDLASDPRGYWDDVLRDARSPLDGAARAAARAELGAVDAESWTQYREPVWELAARFKAAGGRTAMLSNCGPEVIDRVRAQRDVGRYFDAMVISWEERVAKPAPEIYRTALRRLGVAAGEALFVDDRAENVAGAEAVGMQGLVFSGDASVEALQRALDGALPR
jgi:putative hydrolase of the HAD superfamily